MSANPDTVAPTGRNKPAQGKERSDAALGHASQNTSSPEWAEEGGALPHSWKRSKLAELLTVLRGVSYKKEDASSAPATDRVPILRATNIQNGLVFEDFVHVPRRYVSDEQLLRQGDIVIAASSGSRNIVGKAAQLTTEWFGSFGTFCFGLRPKPGVHPGYLAWFLQTSEYRHQVSELSAGVNINNLRATHIEEIPIPVAPLPEQRRIVAEIEKQFTRLEAGVAALRRVQANLKRYRAAVLKAACEGRLVPTQAELAKDEGRRMKDEKKRAQSAASTSSFILHPSSFESGSALLARILTARRQNWQGRGPYKEPAAPDTTKLSPLPEGWTWASVEQLGRATTGFTPPKNDASLFGGDIPFFKPPDLDVGYYVREFRDSLTEAGAEHGRVLPPLSILVTCIGATIGKTGLARVRCTTNQQINALTVPIELVSPQFVYWCFNSPFGQRQIIDNASATTLPILNKSRFEALPIPLPPRAEQTRIVAEVERRLSVAEECEAVVSANLQRATRLRQSILQRAFTGNLLGARGMSGAG